MLCHQGIIGESHVLELRQHVTVIYLGSNDLPRFEAGLAQAMLAPFCASTPLNELVVDHTPAVEILR
ncbi:hypothetical protein FCV25MIE_11128 [Fagus crenata]